MTNLTVCEWDREKDSDDSVTFVHLLVQISSLTFELEEKKPHCVYLIGINDIFFW